jgi:hypothetical protein
MTSRRSIKKPTFISRQDSHTTRDEKNPTAFYGMYKLIVKLLLVCLTVYDCKCTSYHGYD